MIFFYPKTDVVIKFKIRNLFYFFLKIFSLFKNNPFSCWLIFYEYYVLTGKLTTIEILIYELLCFSKPLYVLEREREKERDRDRVRERESGISCSVRIYEKKEVLFFSFNTAWEKREITVQLSQSERERERERGRERERERERERFHVL